MKDKHAKIDKLLAKADALTAEALSAAKAKQRDKKLAAAETLSRKALALSRAQADSESSGTHLIASVHRLASVLVRQGREEEASPLLAECCLMEQCMASASGRACAGYYGSILCDQGAYNEAGVLLSSLIKATELVTPTEDYEALCRGLGNAGRAFTYSDAVGYSGSEFVAPLERLLKWREQGIAVGSEHMKKAAYFAASEELYHTCYDAVSNSDAGNAANLAQCCLEECRVSGEEDFFRPAAMRLIALAAARNCQFGDCVEQCQKTLEVCSSYTYGKGTSPFGSIQSIAADINLLLGAMHYRASRFEECIRYFDAAVAALEADAQGRPLKDVGYAEVERIFMRMTSAEKSAFAHRYLGLSMYALEETYGLANSVEEVRKGAELLESLTDSEPYLGLASSADYHIIAQMYERHGDGEKAAQYEQLSESCHYRALADLGTESLYEQRMESLGARKRTALRLGLLELYGYYTRFEIMLSDEPYTKPDQTNLAYLNFQMGEYCRVVGKYDQAQVYYDAVRDHTFDEKGSAFYDVNRYDFWEVAAVAKAACLVRMDEIPKACQAYAEFVDFQRTQSGGRPDKQQLVTVANTSREIGLLPAVCAQYFHEAAEAFAAEGKEAYEAAELYNQEGICWYNASPEPDSDDESAVSVQEHMQEYAARELAAFEKALIQLSTCDPTLQKVIDLKPSLLSNIGECYVRAEQSDKALRSYLDSVTAFEDLFATNKFADKSDAEQKSYVMQYGVCFKTLGEIFDSREDNQGAADYFTKAIEVFERVDSDAARRELAYCLNARGCIRYRLGDYRGEVEDITRAIALKQDDKGGEITMAIMLKNRSDAYRELGNYKSMHSDLSKSLDMLDQSGMPEEVLNSFYGSHWFSMGVCQEGLHKAGKAADAYRKAARYIGSAKRQTDDDSNTFMQALCHFRRAICLCRRDEQEFYGALFEYNNAIDLLEHLPSSKEKNENLKQVLSSRAGLYEVFREIDLAKADYRRAETLGRSVETEPSSVSSDTAYSNPS